jgi:hypothetical protein
MVRLPGYFEVAQPKGPVSAKARRGMRKSRSTGPREYEHAPRLSPVAAQPGAQLATAGLGDAYGDAHWQTTTCATVAQRYMVLSIVVSVNQAMIAAKVCCAWNCLYDACTAVRRHICSGNYWLDEHARDAAGAGVRLGPWRPDLKLYCNRSRERTATTDEREGAEWRRCKQGLEVKQCHQFG